MNKAFIRIVKPNVELITPKHWFECMAVIVETCGRTSHKSEGLMEEGSYKKFIPKIAHVKGHKSIQDHAFITVRYIGSRSMSHQLVRHRIAAFTQESQRYCDYSNDKKVTAMSIIVPPSIFDIPDWLNGKIIYTNAGNLLINDHTDAPSQVAPSGSDYLLDYLRNEPCYSAKIYRLEIYLNSLIHSYWSYLQLRDLEVPAEDARYVLNNASKTEVCTTFDVTEWRHFFITRCDKHAQWEIRDLAKLTLQMFLDLTPVFFEDLKYLLE